MVGIVAITRNPKAILNKSFSYFAFSVAFWSYCYFFWQISDNANNALFWCRVLMTGAIFIPSTFFHFSVTLIKQRERYLKSIRLWYLISIFFLILDFTPLFVKDVKPRLFFPYWPSAGIVYTPFLAMFIGLTIYTHILMYKNFRVLTGFERNQIKYVFLGTAIGFLGGATNYPLWYDIPIPPVGNIFVAVYVFLVACAIIKYRLMDIRIFTLRGLVFGIVYAMVLGIPLGLVKWGKLWLKTIFGEGWFWLPVFILFGLATLGPIIYNYIRRRAEDVMLKEEHQYQSILHKFSVTITLVKNLNQLLKLIVYRVNKTVKVKFSCIYLADNIQSKFIQKFIYTSRGFSPEIDKEISYNTRLITYLKTRHKPILVEELSKDIREEINFKTGFIVPCFIHQQLLGFLVLGAKSSGRIWTEGDMGVFEVLANQTGLAIENSLFLEESQKNQAQLFATERMASLGTMAGGMTHQINNRFHVIALAASDAIDTLKLMSIDNCSSDVQDSLKSIQHALEAITKNTEHGGKIVNDFLNFSQPDRRQKEIKEFAITEPLERAIEMLKIKTALDEGIITQEIQPDLPLIEGNFVLLQDCFFNLLSNDVDAISLKENAIKNKQFSSLLEGYKGKIVIRIYKINSHLIVQFHDNGIGMTKDTQRKIFVPFFTTKATSIKGTGLGLFVIQKIIATHQGEINVDSNYGQGTTFTIKLPISQQKKEN